MAITGQGLHIDAMASLAQYEAQLQADAEFNLAAPSFLSELQMPAVFQQDIGRMVVDSVRSQIAGNLDIANNVLDQALPGWQQFRQDPVANFHRVGQFYSAAGLPEPQWLRPLLDALQRVSGASAAPTSPRTRQVAFLADPNIQTASTNPLDLALGGFEIPGVPGVPGAVTQLCNLGFGTWSGGICWTIKPRPRRTTQVCVWGACTTIVLDYGHPGQRGTVTSSCNLGTGIWQNGQCWTIPPIPPIQVPGICQPMGIPCSTEALVTQTIMPALTGSLDAIVGAPPVVIVDTGFDNGLDAILSGLGLKMQVDLRVLGNPVSFEIDWDFNQMGNSVSALVQQVIGRMW